MSAPSLQWNLKTVMYGKGIRSTARLQRELAQHGVLISAVQLGRIIDDLPVRMNTHVLAALCSALSCTPGDLLQLPQQAQPAVKKRPTRARKATVLPDITDVAALVGPAFRLRRTIREESSE